MNKLRQLFGSRGWAVVVVLLLTAYQVARLVVFANVHGGIEHDSGWFLTVSRSLAERGEFTTLVSTIVDPAAPGAIDIDQKFNVQADDGRIWFFTGNGNGPVSIVANALVLKLFGFDFWALRGGPLLFYALFLLLAAVSLYHLAGLWAVGLFHAFIFFYPHLSIFLGYEAMGEVASMVFILLTYLTFAWAATRARRRAAAFFLAGLLAGLTLNTKLITLWSISGVFAWAGLLWLAGFSRRGRQLTAGQLRFTELLWLGLGIPLTLALWELAQLVVLTRLVGFDLYRQHVWQRIKFILDDGSGVGLQLHSGPEFFWDKFFLLAEATHPQRWVVAILFGAILLGGLWLLWQWRTQPAKQHLLAALWFGWLANTAWFVGLAKTGWPRHFWFGLVLAVLLLSVLTVRLLRRERPVSGATAAHRARQVTGHRSQVTGDRSQVTGDRSQVTGDRLQITGRGPRVTRHASRVTPYSSLLTPYASLLTGLLLLTLIGWGFVSQPHVWGVFVPDEIVPYWQQKQINNKYHASLPWVIIPREAQAEVADYIEQMPPEARVYYPGQHKTAEIPPLTGRVQYPFNRHKYVTPQPEDIVLVGPSLISPWKDPIQRRDLLQLVAQQCPRPAVRNEFYMICPFKDNPPPP